MAEPISRQQMQQQWLEGRCCCWGRGGGSKVPFRANCSAAVNRLSEIKGKTQGPPGGRACKMQGLKKSDFRPAALRGPLEGTLRDAPKGLPLGCPPPPPPCSSRCLAASCVAVCNRCGSCSLELSSPVPHRIQRHAGVIVRHADSNPWPLD